MGYRPLWNAERNLGGVQLFLHDEPEKPVDTAHLLRILREMWAPSSPLLLLSPQSVRLLQALLSHITPNPDWALEVRAEWLADHPALHTGVALAAQRGVRLVWRGGMNQLPTTDEANHYACSLLHLEPQDALILMRAPLNQPVPQRLALLEGQMYEEIHSQTLARRCLEHYHASAIAGWPTDDVLHRVRGARVLHPSHAHVLRLMKAVDADQSLETFEEILSEDPLLAYRFMLFANSAALGARNPINSLRRALVMLGYGTLKEWLGTQLIHASHEKDLQPIRLSMVMRAALTSHLLDAGVSQELRSEVYLCGLFSRLHEVLDEPLETTLTRLPLSERIPQAAVQGEGPYAPSLQLAQALESEDGAHAIRALCEEHEISLEHVNRTLLRLVCGWPNQRPSW
ncbi:HDOD domain-containing protein [Comamonas aquatica]|nr:HDOD domain-containing protein [Comamonas aquatica]MDH0370866.1 HDOD domain-containing protein [Comamonas aquatica]